MAEDTDLTCDDCGATKNVRHYVNYTTKDRYVLCTSCCAERNHPRNRCPEAWAAWMAERQKKALVPDPAKKKPATPAGPDPEMVAAAVPRLAQEAKRLEHPAPDPRSPHWVGRDLEVEGWDRKVLVAAVAQALDDGALVAGFYRDGWGNRKRQVTVATAPVDPFA